MVRCAKRAMQVLACVAGIVGMFTLTAWSGKPGGGGGGGAPVPRIPLKIILLAGQSNMAGYGLNADLVTLVPELLTPQADVLIYRANTPGSANGLWRELQPGFGDGTNPGDYFGPELTFGRTMADALSDDNFALIKPHTTLNSLALDFDPDTPGASWTLLVDTVNNAVATIDSTVYAPEIAGMIWCQGGRDVQFEDQALAYEENLTNFIQAIRDEFGKPNLPFIIAQLHHPDERPFGAEVFQANVNVSQNTPNTGLVYTEDLTTGADGVHFDALGQLILGVRFADETLAINPVTVDSVSYSLVSGSRRRQNNLVVTVAIRDEMGPVPGTRVSATVHHESGNLWDVSGMTDGSGTVALTVTSAPAGCYTTTVNDIGVLIWDPLTPANGFCN